MVSQLKGLLGLKISSQGFLDTLTKVVRNIHETSLWDTAMSFSCIAILLMFRVIYSGKLKLSGGYSSVDCEIEVYPFDCLENERY